MSDLYGVAREHGRALFMLTEEVGTTERVREDACAVVKLLSDNPDYIKLLDTPALSPDCRLALIDEAFGALDVYLVNLIKILTKKSLAYLIPKTLAAFEDDYMESRGIVRAEAVTAVPLDEARCETLRMKLEKITGKQIIIENKVDPTILGGIKLRYMGIQRDGSVKTRLDSFKDRLADAVI